MIKLRNMSKVSELLSCKNNSNSDASDSKARVLHTRLCWLSFSKSASLHDPLFRVELCSLPDPVFLDHPFYLHVVARRDNK